MKVCSSKKCVFGGKLQPLNSFGKNKKNKDGLQSRCKSCKKNIWNR
mgnify:CR=1 FL=1